MDAPTSAPASGSSPLSSSLPSASAVTNSSIPQTFIPQTFNHPLPVKLDDDNYLPWRHQVMSTIKGFRLQKYIMGERFVPPQFLSPADEENGKLNEAFVDWEVQDSLLLSWLLQSMSEPMTRQMIGCGFSYQVWESLESQFAKQSRVKVNQYRTHLRTIKKDNSSMNEYFLKIKKIVDTLAAIGSPISFNEHIEAVFGGLDDDYEGIITSLLARVEPFTISELHAMLITQEECISLKKKNAQVLQANLVQSGTKDKRNFNVQQNGNMQTTNQFAQRAQNSSRGRSRGRGGNFGQKLICQLCGRTGHVAYKCYFRFDQAYISPFAVNHTNPSTSNPSYPQTPRNQALIATTDTVFYPNWYPDSGASCHLTSDASNLVS